MTFLLATLYSLFMFLQTSAKPTNVHVSAGLTEGCTVTSASLTNATVQSAINSIGSGTVCLPSGSASWSGISISNKQIKLQGAGSALTNITSTGWPTLTFTVSSSNFVELQGLSINDGDHSNTPAISINGGSGTSTSSGDVGFHIHDVIMTNVRIGIEVNDNMYGLIDHVNLSGSGQMVRITGDGGSTNGSLAWDILLNFNSNQWVYIEDSTLNGTPGCDGATDSYNGGRSVLRHNIIKSCGGGGHGTDSGGHRAPVAQLIYANQYNFNVGDPEKRISTLRGGTQIVYDNTQGVAGIVNGVTIQYWRMTDGSTTSFSDWGRCNGTNYKMKSSFDGVTGGTLFASTGDLDSWGTGGSFTAFLDGAGVPTSGLCRDQPGRGPRQLSAPIYLWNNAAVLGDAGPYCAGNPSCDMDTGIVANRDYFNYVSSGFTGATGVGRGTLAARPATCTIGVAYWSTTDGVLFQCSSTNTWTTYYTPYQYPHPFNTGS